MSCCSIDECLSREFREEEMRRSLQELEICRIARTAAGSLNVTAIRINISLLLDQFKQCLKPVCCLIARQISYRLSEDLKAKRTGERRRRRPGTMNSRNLLKQMQPQSDEASHRNAPCTKECEKFPPLYRANDEHVCYLTAEYRRRSLFEPADVLIRFASVCMKIEPISSEIRPRFQLAQSGTIVLRNFGCR
jgi:hypothetical protein